MNIAIFLLISFKSLRLLSMGNIEYSVDDRFNEINFYDLLDSPSAFLIDNNGKSQALFYYNFNNITTGDITNSYSTFGINSELKFRSIGGRINLFTYVLEDYKRFYIDILLSKNFKEFYPGFKLAVIRDEIFGFTDEEIIYNFSIMRKEIIGKLKNLMNFDFNITSIKEIDTYNSERKNFYTFNASNIVKGKRTTLFFNALITNMFTEQIGVSFISKVKLDTSNNSNFLILLDYKRAESSINLLDLLSGISYKLKNILFGFEGKYIIGFYSGTNETILGELRGGIEYSINDKIFLRFGFNIKSTPSYLYFYLFPEFFNYYENFLFPLSGTNISAGIGFREKIGNWDFMLGYSIPDNQYIYQNSLSGAVLLNIVP